MLSENSALKVVQDEAIVAAVKDAKKRDKLTIVSAVTGVPMKALNKIARTGTVENEQDRRYLITHLIK